MVEVEVHLRPQPKQLRVWDIVREAAPDSLSAIGYGGAVGGGKTWTLAAMAQQLALTYPGNRILIARKDLVDLRTTTLEEVLKITPAELWQRAPSITEARPWGALRLPDWPEGVNSRLFFRDAKDIQGLGSEEYGAAMLEEAGEIPERAALMILSRLRLTVARKRVFIAASNPWPGWFERWFVKREIPEEVLRAAGGAIHFVPSGIRDNAHLPDNYEALLRALYAGHPEWIDRFIEGRFDAFAGQVYPELNHSLQWYGRLPKFARLVGGLDFGGQRDDAHKTAGVVAGIAARDLSIPVAREGDLIRFAHFEDAGPKVHDDLIDWMRTVEVAAGRRVNWRADKTQQWGISMARRLGFHVAESHGGADSVTAGIGLVRRRMRDGASHYTEELLKPPAPGSQSWYESMTRYRWAEQPDEDRAAPGTPIKRDDDTPDADRYMHEEADGFPEYTGPPVHKLTAGGRERARSAV